MLCAALQSFCPLALRDFGGFGANIPIFDYIALEELPHIPHLTTAWGSEFASVSISVQSIFYVVSTVEMKEPCLKLQKRAWQTQLPNSGIAHQWPVVMGQC